MAPGDTPEEGRGVVDGSDPRVEQVAPAVTETPVVAPASDPKAGELAGAVADAVVAQPEAGKLHGEFADQVKGIEEAMAAQDVETLAGRTAEAYTVEDIRYNQRLLKKKEGDEKLEDQVKNLKEETARRMRAYTTDTGDGWFQLDYAKFGADKNGLTHELYVGLGDILLDLDIQEVLVEKGGVIVKAHRGVVSSGQHSGRIGFLDENGEYVATHTGDKFRILSNDEMEASVYSGKLTEETMTREAGRASFKSGTVDLYVAEKDVTMKEGVNLSDTYTDAGGRTVTVGVNNEIIEKAAAECAGSAEADRAVERENLMKVVNYIAYKIGVPSYAILAVVKHECSVRFPVIGGRQDGGLAKGMGQIHPEGWATVKKDPRFGDLVGQVMKEAPGEAGRNRNIFVDLVGVAIFVKMGFETFGFEVDHNTSSAYLLEEQVASPDGISMTRMAWTRMFYHVPSYARDYAKVIKAGSVDVLDDRRKQRFTSEAQPWLRKNMHRYKALSDTAVLARRAIDAKEGISV